MLSSGSIQATVITNTDENDEVDIESDDTDSSCTLKLNVGKEFEEKNLFGEKTKSEFKRNSPAKHSTQNNNGRAESNDSFVKWSWGRATKHDIKTTQRKEKAAIKQKPIKQDCRKKDDEKLECLRKEEEEEQNAKNFDPPSAEVFMEDNNNITDEERQTFPEFFDSSSSYNYARYLLIRNEILKKW